MNTLAYNLLCISTYFLCCSFLRVNNWIRVYINKLFIIHRFTTRKEINIAGRNIQTAWIGGGKNSSFILFPLTPFPFP